jgi:spore cortex formation protein SpoVR/YcgB (stage V sporulation)
MCKPKLQIGEKPIELEKAVGAIFKRLASVVINKDNSIRYDIGRNTSTKSTIVITYALSHKYKFFFCLEVDRTDKDYNCKF